MKDQYFGDVNDYRKYGLLRALMRHSGLTLGVCWFKTPADGRRDGEFRRYLEHPRKWRHFDPELYDRLQVLKNEEAGRRVRYAEEWQVLPGALFEEAEVPRSADDRRTFFSTALGRLAPADLLFLDPDNGIEVPSRKLGTRHSPKYVYWTEIEEANRLRKSLLIYQHYPMHVRRTEFESRLAAAASSRVETPGVTVFATAHVAFLLVPHSLHEEALRDADRVVAGSWRDQIRPWRG